MRVGVGWGEGGRRSTGDPLPHYLPNPPQSPLPSPPLRCTAPSSTATQSPLPLAAIHFPTAEITWSTIAGLRPLGRLMDVGTQRQREGGAREEVKGEGWVSAEKDNRPQISLPACLSLCGCIPASAFSGKGYRAFKTYSTSYSIAPLHSD